MNFIRSKQPDKRLMISPHDLDSARPFFDGDQSTKILIHGWLGNGKDQTSVCTTLKTGESTLRTQIILQTPNRKKKKKTIPITEIGHSFAIRKQ